MKILQITPDQANDFIEYILPGVIEQPESGGFWYAIATEEDEGLLGMIVVDPQADGAILESVVTVPGKEGRGIATELVNHMIRTLAEQKVPFLFCGDLRDADSWRSLDYMLTHWGFTREEGSEDHLYAISLADAAQLPLYRRYAGKKLSRVHAVASLSPTQRHSLNAFLHREAGLVTGSLKDCDPDCSFVWQEEGKTHCVFLLSPLAGTSVFNIWTWLDAKAQNPAILISTIVRALSAAAEKHPADTEIFFTGMTEGGRHLLEHMLKGYETAYEQRSYLLHLPTPAILKKAEVEIPEEEETISSILQEKDDEPEQEDIGATVIDQNDMVCRDCRYRDPADSGECEFFIDKPGAVYFGQPCRYYEKEE